MKYNGVNIISERNRPMDIKELLAYCDHTLLRVDCTEAEIRKLCDQAIKYGCA